MRVFLASLLFLSAGLASVVHSPEGKAWWAHVQFLADDKLAGRATGSEGYREAAEYVAGQFKSAGLKPAGTQGYFQPVKFRSRQIVEEKSRLALIRDGKSKDLKLGTDAYFSLRSEPDKLVEAPAVFVGYGLQIPEMKIDDLAGVDLRGKIAVCLSGAPKRVPAPLAAHYQSASERWKRLKAAGAIGSAAFTNPKHSDIPWARAKLARLLPSMSLADPKLVDAAGQRIAIAINPEHADAWFDGTGHTASKLLALDDAQRPLPKFPLKVQVRAEPVFQVEEVVSPNVAAIVPGNDPKLKDEYVVLSAHLDHLGRNKTLPGDGIYNGAIDNASGIASILEIGKQIAEKKTNRRSLLLVAVTGEEKGLLGSKYFANYPTVKPESIVANINLDMYLPLIPLKSVTAYGAQESTLGPEFEKIAGKFGVKVIPDREPERNLFIRSDQYSFIRQGVPALAFKFVAGPGSPEEEVLKNWIRNRYHSPSDDISQPVEIEAAVKFNQMLLAFTEQVAKNGKRPVWNENSFFKRFEKR